MLEPILSDATIAGQASASTTRTDYDWKGQKIFVSYPGSGSPDITALTTGTHSLYDALERLTDTQQDSELGTLTTHTAYLAGAQQQVTDPKNYDGVSGLRSTGVSVGDPGAGAGRHHPDDQSRCLRQSAVDHAVGPVRHRD
jgi:hypothetical protein